MEIGEQISAQRIRKGWTQQQLSEESGISLRTIQRIEKNQVSAQLHTINRLQEILDIELSDEGNHQSILTLMGTSALIIIIPVIGNILIPLFILLVGKRSEDAKKLGGAFIFLQIIWTVLAFIFSIIAFNLTQFIFGESNPGNFNPITMVFVLFWLVNLILIVTIILQSKSGKNRLLSKLPTFF